MSDITTAQVKVFLSKMTVLEMSELIKELEESWGVSAAAPVAMMSGGGGPVEAVEEQTEFDVRLIGIGNAKIQVIKAVRELTGLGLKEAKALVDEVPSTIKEAVSKDDAEAAKTKLESVGAEAEIK